MGFKEFSLPPKEAQQLGRTAPRPKRLRSESFQPDRDLFFLLLLCHNDYISPPSPFEICRVLNHEYGNPFGSIDLLLGR